MVAISDVVVEVGSFGARVQQALPDRNRDTAIVVGLAMPEHDSKPLARRVIISAPKRSRTKELRHSTTPQNETSGNTTFNPTPQRGRNGAGILDDQSQKSIGDGVGHYRRQHARAVALRRQSNGLAGRDFDRAG